jgi:terminase small subunit-like protein
MPRHNSADGLSPKQRRFVAEYLIDLNAAEAAIRAGYSHKTARSVGSENLTKPDIQASDHCGASAPQRTDGDDPRRDPL